MCPPQRADHGSDQPPNGALAERVEFADVLDLVTDSVGVGDHGTVTSQSADVVVALQLKAGFAAVCFHIPPTRRVRIPMVAGSRSLNLSNAVSIALFEAWRQHGYAGSVGNEAMRMPGAEEGA